MVNDSQIVISKNDIELLARQWKEHHIHFLDIPEEYWLDPIFVKEMRKSGILKSDKRGYDVIRDVFFVVEIVLDEIDRNIKSIFPDFASYYEFLDGDIYMNACYFDYNFSQEEISTYDIDLSKINNIALIDVTINDFSLEFSEEELQQYKKIEKDKLLRKKWITKFNSCNTYEEFLKVLNNFRKSKFEGKGLLFFFYNFIFADKAKAFDIIMKYVSTGAYPSEYMIRELCHIYNQEKVINAYKNSGSKFKYYRNKKYLKRHIESLNNGEVRSYEYKYFDKNTHFFCHEERYTNDRQYPLIVYRFFETFREFAEYLNNDLSRCDLSKAILSDIDFADYKTDEYTKLPIQNSDDLIYSVYKGYDRNGENFVVNQRWLNKNGQILKEYTNTFNYFFDFAYFLNNDLSNADLLFCDGIDNLGDVANLILTHAKLSSRMLDKLGTQYALNSIDMTNISSFLPIVKNEEETAHTLTMTRLDELNIGLRFREVYYISDLHLLHRIKNASCKSEDDVLYVIQRIIDSILKECWNIILIGGDTSSNFSLFSLFLQLLRKTMDEKHICASVIFILGNHELWDFPDSSFKEVVEKYKTVITKYKMHLLQNNIIYDGDNKGIQEIAMDELLSSPKQMLREQLKSARIILFGGLAFSGYNEEFNANNGIYRQAIDRNQEIAESKEFERLYNIVCETLPDKKNVIIFTHTPQQDWCSNNHQQPGFIYVNGHTHKNYFYDDGEYRIYADNQIGYNHENPVLKYFYVDGTYDLFSEYSDGIYEITKKDYIDFFNGKNLRMSFTRDIYSLYMLKKNGYYCFIHENQFGGLTILNRGARKRLGVDDINYYYNRMDSVIARIKKPLDKFTAIQNQIANEVKFIGGSGTIHGAIIDIDFFNHIYVNPFDLTVTGYWASDIIHKKVFTSIPKLLQENCPSLYANYLNLLNEKTENALVIHDNTGKEPDVVSNIYLDTDIYKASLEIKKMQVLNSNILATWHEPRQKVLKQK